MKRRTFFVLIILVLSTIGLQTIPAQIVFEHGDSVDSVAFSPVDDTLLVSGLSDGTVKLWDVETQTVVATLAGHTSWVVSLAFSPNGMLLASGSYDDTVKLWNLETHANIATLKEHAADVESVAFSPDGRTLAAGAADGMVKLWDVETHQNTATFGGYDAAVLEEGGWYTPVSFLSNTILAVGALDSIKLWDVVAEENIATFEVPGDSVVSVSFSPDGTTLASSSQNSIIQLWNVATGENTATFPLPSRYSFPLPYFSFSPDGTLIAAKHDESIGLWDIETGTLINTLFGHTGAVRSVSFSFDGSLASGALDGTVRLWDLSSLQAAKETLVASTAVPLTEANLDGSTITLRLTGRQFVDEWRIDNALSVSGIEGVTFTSWNVERVRDTVATVELEFAGNIDTDATLTLTVGPDAIVGGYDKAFTFQFPVTAVEESLIASTAAPLAEVSQFPFSRTTTVKESLEALTEAPLTEATLNGGIITLTLTGRRFRGFGYVNTWYTGNLVSFSGIDGVTVAKYGVVHRMSDTVAIIELEFAGNIDTDATLTLTVGADTIGYDKDFIFQFPVTAVEESLQVSTEAPLTEATLDGGIIVIAVEGSLEALPDSPLTEAILNEVIILTLTGRHFAGSRSDIRDALSVSGIDGLTVDDVGRVSDTVAIVELEFAGNIDTDTTLTLTVGADAIGYDKDFTLQLPVTAVEESLEASTEAPLTEATLDGNVITLTLTGRQFVDDSSEIKDALSVSGIEGAAVTEYGAIRRVSDTEAAVELTFSGNIDEDATLTLTVGAEAIRYDKDFTFEFPVTAVEESLTASTEFPLTEATLDGSTITLSLSGRQFADRWYYEEDDFSVSGIDGVTFGYRERVSDTEIAIPLEFDGTDFDTDATLTFTLGASFANYNQALTAQVPVTAIKQSNATVSIAPSPVVSPNIGEPLTLNLNIIGGKNVAGYQATVLYDHTALRLVDTTNGDYLPADAFFLANRYRLRLTANTLAEAANGDGTLATLTFEVVDFKASTLTLSKVYLVDADGRRWEATTESGEVTIPPELAAAILGDINRDGVVNIQDLVIVSARFGQRGQNSADINGDSLIDIVDLVLVASAVGEAAAAPPLNPQALERLTAGDIQGWLARAQQLTLTDPAYLRGITVLEQLLKTLTPKKTALLPNYPNPFNPETWIPYHLSRDVDVQISIYNTKGVLVRRLNLGHQMAGYYTDRTKAAYWDGKNAFGERVASGLYFYHLAAGDYSSTRKMLILK